MFRYLLIKNQVMSIFGMNLHMESGDLWHCFQVPTQLSIHMWGEPRNVVDIVLRTDIHFSILVVLHDMPTHKSSRVATCKLPYTSL